MLFVTHSIDEAVFLSDRIYVLSAKPAAVIKEVEIPFPRPRSEELLLSDEFFHLKRDLYAALKPTFST